MKLYDYSGAPNPRRVQLFLAEKGVAIDTEQVDLRQGAQFAEAYRAINPLCTVPALALDDGTVLAQVPAIFEYLEAVYPEPPMLGSAALERALVREWCHRIFSEGFLAVAEILRNTSPGFVERALPGPAKHEQIATLAERGRRRLPECFRALDERLADREFLVGARFSAADIDALVLCDFARWVKESVPEDCSALRRWYEATKQRPSVLACAG